MPSNAPAADAAVALAQASAEAGVAAARLGYALTNKALDESSAAAVFPLLALELTSIGASFATYAAVDLAWEAARVTAGITFEAESAARGLSS